MNSRLFMGQLFKTLRNNASPAHPNEALLGEHEALLAINVARTIFSYIDSKVRA